MARYPLMEPKWAHLTEGHEATAWDEAKRQCRGVLCGWAGEGRYGIYSELCRLVTAVPWPEGAFTHGGRQVGTLLGQVSLDELDRTEDRPVMSALVVSSEENMPSEGFWTFVDQTLGIDVGSSTAARLDFWVAEFKRARDFYGSQIA